METVHSINLIVSKPTVRGGRPCIAGTGVRVTDVVMASLFHNQTPNETASWYGVTLADIHAALAYYYEHKADIDADIRSQIDRARTLEKKLSDASDSLLPR